MNIGSNTALASATSVGLAKSFSERAKELKTSIWWWVGFLVGALSSALFLSIRRASELSELFKLPNITTGLIGLHFLTSIVLIGAPVWFAWLATRQIGKRFKLAEDYAFKAATAQAYEGFRREAENINKDMSSQLLTSFLTRFDESPLRLMEKENHGSPLHEVTKGFLKKKISPAKQIVAEKTEENSSSEAT